MRRYCCTRRRLALAGTFLALGLILAFPATGRTQPPGNPQPGFPVPDFENLFPPGMIDPEQLKMLKKLMEANQAELQKMFEEMRKQFAQGFPGGPGMFPGGMPGFPNMGMPGFVPFGSVGRENRLGAVLQAPSQTLVDQLDLPDKQGLVLKTVKPGSAAAKNGLKANDILLELAGKPVPSSVDGFVKQLNGIKKDTPVDAVVLRKGKKETVKGIKLGEVPAENNPFGGFGGFGGGMPNFQMQPGFFPGAGALPGGTNMSMTRGPGGAFTTKYKEGDITITISGKIDQGKADVASIEIREGDQAKTYKSVKDVPEDFREDVRVLIRRIENGNSFSFRQFGG
jgi:membrane-associated protease RseP (regulator of RpoE activity)